MSTQQSLKYKGYRITPTAHPIDVRILVGGQLTEVVRQGFAPYISISRDEGDTTFDRSYNTNEGLRTEEEARVFGIEFAKAVIDGKVKDVTPP